MLHPPLRDPRDPIEKYGMFALKCLVYLWLSYCFYQAVDMFDEYVPGKHWPFMLNMLRMFTFLPIHEAGHFIFALFGRTLHILGGSFWQIVFPLLWFIIAARQKSHVAPFALFWVGENFMDVSLYMRDAPVRQLPLLGGHKSGHDWYNLFTDWDMMSSAETIADVMFYFGAVLCIGAIVSGIFLAIRSLITPPPQPGAVAAGEARAATVEGTLDNFIEQRESNEML